MSTNQQQNITYGDISVKNYKVHATSEKSLTEILNLADQIWTEIKNLGIRDKDDQETDRYLTRLRAKHSDFARAFPIPFRWMVQTQEYSPKAFELFLTSQVKTLYKDRKAFLAAQGEYLVLLYKQRNPKAGGKKIADYRRSVVLSLEKDDKSFSEANEKAKEEVKKLDEAVDKERRERLFEYLTKLKQQSGDK